MKRETWPALLAEAGGTFLFFFVGAGSVVIQDYGRLNGGATDGVLGVALAHGLVLAVLVSALGAISGAHFNPAVTFGVWLAGRIPAVLAVAYVLAQLLGGLLAGLCLRALLPTEAWMPSNIGTPALGPGIGPLQGIVIEAILTVVLLLAVFGTAVDPRGPKVGGLAIGLAVAADILVGGPLTGAAMNPARWFGPALASGALRDAVVWIMGPLLGAAVAALAYRALLPGADVARTPGEPAPDPSPERTTPRGEPAARP